MKLCITSQGETLEAAVDPRFARAPFFIVYDSETDEWQAVDNAQNVQAAGGAGPQAAQNLANLGAEVVLTGHCGPNAFRTLGAAGIQVIINVEGTVADAVQQYKAGGLTPTEAPDVQGHWT
ncbi:MAG: NifB/NifX family molybdenum-iron cluster-binding protein [Planctomycetota bacterium]|nr:NifB/NifX family molybdenum-iron cluster-binding protein [Planctomycetota bacterium]